MRAMNVPAEQPLPDRDAARMEDIFAHSITYLCEHNEHGAMGIIINRPIELTLRRNPRASRDRPACAATTSRSWPAARCRPSAASCCTARANAGTGSRRCRHRRDQPHHLARYSRGDRARRRAARARWSHSAMPAGAAGQLEQELAENAWLTCPADSDPVRGAAGATRAGSRRARSASISSCSQHARHTPERPAMAASRARLRFRPAPHRRRGGQRAHRHRVAAGRTAGARRRAGLGTHRRLIGEWQPTLLLVGLPLNMDGTRSAMSERAARFARRLHGRFGLPV